MSPLSLALVVLRRLHPLLPGICFRSAPLTPARPSSSRIILFACLVYLPWMIWLLIYGDLHVEPALSPAASCSARPFTSPTACCLLARLSGRRPLGGLPDRARHRARCCRRSARFILLRETPTAAGHLRAARGRRRDRLHHHAGRSFGVPPTARPRYGVRWGTATGSLIAGYTVVDGYGVKVLGIHPVVLDWVTNSAALLHHAADRSVERASRAREDEGLLAAGVLGSARCRRRPTSSCCQPSRWARRSAWSRPRAKCR